MTNQLTVNTTHYKFGDMGEGEIVDSRGLSHRNLNPTKATYVHVVSRCIKLYKHLAVSYTRKARWLLGGDFQGENHHADVGGTLKTLYLDHSLFGETVTEIYPE